MIKIFEQVSFDPAADACYIKVSDAKITETQQKSESCFVDLDKQGNIVGIEVLHVKKNKALINRILMSQKPLAQCV